MKRYTIASRKFTGSNVLSLMLKPAAGTQPLRFLAGQYVAIGFRRGSQRTPMRCFSITTAPNEAGEIGIAFRTAGNFTRAFADASIGSIVDVTGPFGVFTVPRDDNHPLVFLAGGIGITPFISLLRDLASRPIQQPVTLLYSCRTLHDVPFAAELMALAQANSTLTIRFLVDSVPPEQKAHPLIIEGKLTADILRTYAGLDTQYYVCGPAGYAAVCQRFLRELAVPQYCIRSEAFSQSSKMQIAGFALQKLIYALCAATVVAGAAVLMAKDSWESSAAKTQAATTTSNQTTTTQATPTTDYTTPTSATPTTTDSMTSTTPNTATSSNSTMPTYQPTYQPPTTSMS